MKRPKPFDLRPAKGPTLHATPIRPPGPRSPGWYWRVVVYEAGAERTVWTGRGTVDEVNAALWQLVGRGGHIHRAEPEAEAVEVRTVADLLGYWRGHLAEERGDLAASTVATYTSHSRVLEEVLGKVLVDQLGRRDADRYRAIVTRPPAEGSRRWAQGRSAASLRMDMLCLAMAWAWGRSVGACPDRDLDLPEIAAKPVRELYTPSAGEVAAVARRLSGWARDIVALQWATGARAGELAHLRAHDVDLQRRELVVGRQEGARKTGVRRVPLHPDTVPLVRRLLGEATGAASIWPVMPSSIKVETNPAIRAACEAEGIPVWTTHGLRRAYVIRAIRAGVDVATLATITGHTVPVLLAHYRQVQDEDRDAAVAKLPGELPAGVVVELASRRR